jgi:hypothetical protein
MSPEEFGFTDMILAWVFLSVPFAAALFIGRTLERSRTRDARRRERDERDPRD